MYSLCPFTLHAYEYFILFIWEKVAHTQKEAHYSVMDMNECVLVCNKYGGRVRVSRC